MPTAVNAELFGYIIFAHHKKNRPRSYCSMFDLNSSHRDEHYNPSNLTSEDTMNAAIARIFPRISAASVAGIDSFVSVALFCGLGLLLSLSVLILDQYIPGEWL
jgi:hypothetical protein